MDHQTENNRAFIIVQYARGVQDGNLFRNAGFIALRLINYDDPGRNRASRLFLGAGGMYEYEDIDAVIPEENHLLRSTNYISYVWKIQDRVNLNLVAYFQFAVTDLSDFRNLLDSTLEFRLSDNLSFIFVAGYHYDNQPPAEVRPFDNELRNGLRLAL